MITVKSFNIPNYNYSQNEIRCEKNFSTNNKILTHFVIFF